MLSRSDYMTLLIQKGASGSRNYPMLSGASYSTYEPTGQSPYFLVYGSKAILPADVMWTHWQWNITTKASLKTADEFISMDSKKLAVPPSSSQQGNLRVSVAIMIATSRNAPSTLAI
jgi:hypothetical protein